MLILDEIMRSRNMNVTDLANRMEARGKKLSRLSITRILNNETSPKLSTLEDIASALDIKVVDLFFKTEKTKSEEELISEIESSLEKLRVSLKKLKK